MQEKIEQYFVEFRSFLDKNGIKKGDTLYVASDISCMLMSARREMGIVKRDEQSIFLHALVDCLKQQVGKAGTLLIPNGGWSFCRTGVFDYRNTEGEMGALGNFIMHNCAEFARTRHPIYNFMVWGADADYLKHLDNQSSWGEDSPFGYLYRKAAKQININVPFNKSITILHYMEQKLTVPYRYHKVFAGLYIDEKGIESERYYSMYVRDIDSDLMENLPEDFFTAAKAAWYDYFHEYKLVFMNLAKVHDLMKDDMMHNQGKNLYHFDQCSKTFGKEENKKLEIKLLSKYELEILEGN